MSAAHVRASGLSTLIACPDCDAVQSARPQSVVARQVCYRCRAVLANPRSAETSGAATSRPLAYVLAAVPLFIAAQSLPLMRLDGAGQRAIVTIGGSARALWDQGLWVPAALVLLTTCLLPAIRLVGVACLLLWRRQGRLPAGASSIAHALELLRPWNQLEILLFGMLVAFGKLAADFRMTPGTGLPCIVAVLLLERLAAAYVDGRRFWAGATAAGVSVGAGAARGAVLPPLSRAA